MAMGRRQLRGAVSDVGEAMEPVPVLKARVPPVARAGGADLAAVASGEAGLVDAAGPVGLAAIPNG